MFTQCYKCETVYRLSAESLRAAGGQVRCGRCGEVFNALARLAEDAAGFTQGESPLDLETRADQILHEIAPLAPPKDGQTEADERREGAPGGGEIAHLALLGDTDDASVPDGSLEFTLPPGELDRIFIETTPSVLQVLAAESLRAERAAAAARAGKAAPVPLPSTTTPSTTPATTPATPPPMPTPPSIPTSAADAPVTSIPPVARPAPATPRITGLEISEAARRDMQAGFEEAALPQLLATRRELPRAAWAAAAVVLALLLLLQMALRNRDWLTAHRSLGADTGPAAQLASYQLRQWGVTGDPEANGTLRVRATVMNVAAQLQPYPLLRVTLANRFGTRVAQRDFEAAEYMGKTTAHMLSPGERADAVLDIMDPGKDAEGFEIDVCVRGTDRKLACAGDAASRTP